MKWMHFLYNKFNTSTEIQPCHSECFVASQQNRCPQNVSKNIQSEKVLQQNKKVSRTSIQKIQRAVHSILTLNFSLSMTAFFVIISKLQNLFCLNYHERDRENRSVFHSRFAGLLAVSFMLLFTSCEKETDLILNDGKLPEIVVQGMLTNEIKSHEVVLSLPVSALNESPQMISGATVTLVGADSTYIFKEDTSNRGHYFSSNWVYGVAGLSYTLNIEYNGKTWSGTDVLQTAHLFTPLTIALTNTADSIYKISYVASGFDPTRFAMYEISLDWRHIDGYDTTNSIATLYFYTLGSLDMGEIVNNDLENVYFPKGTIIKERCYSLSPKYAAWLREILIETQWNNGIVVVQSGNALSNFGPNAAGFFGTCGFSEWNGVAE